MATTQNLVVFGDSLGDDGNLYEMSEGLITNDVREDIGGDLHRFTDGIVFTEYFEGLGLYDTVYNYAVAGAEANGEQTFRDLLSELIGQPSFTVPPNHPDVQTDINLYAQIDQFLVDMEGQSLDGFTAMIEIGGNDYAAFTVSDIDNIEAELLAYLDATTAAILQAAVDLANAGVSTVQIVSLSPIHATPMAAGMTQDQIALWTYLYDSHNAIIEGTLAQLNIPGVTFEYIDLNPLYDVVLDDAESFGFIAPVESVIRDEENSALNDYDADQVMFFDQVHLSTAMHGVLAAYMAALDSKELIDANDLGGLIQSSAAQGALVMAGAGADIALTGLGDDIVFTGSNDDVVSAGDGDDLVSGGSGADTLLSGAGHDIVDGDSGDDLLLAGDGDDVIIDGLGNDIALGGAGADDFVFTEASLIGGEAGDTDIFAGGSGVDTLYLVVSAQTAAELGEEVTTEELAGLGITTFGVENIVVINGRDNLSDMSGESWFASADIWGLI